MRFLITALTLSILSLSSFALNIDTSWSADSRKILNLTCSGDDVCSQFCNGEQCQVEEKVCKNCVGTSITMTYAFKEMGRALVSTESLTSYELFDLLSSGEFVSLTSRSVYNLIYRFDDSELKSKFRGLCNDGTRYPVVFFGTTPSGEMGEIKAVWCDSGVLGMTQLDQLDVEGDLH